MHVVMFRTLGLGAAIIASSSAYAVTLDGGAVAAPDQYGAQVAAEVLKKGGNAVDAAVATAFTLAVTYPEAGNLGGGGFMTLYMDGKPYFLDYREIAPKAASRNMYLDDKGEIIENLSLVGARAAGVPGTVMGLWEAHQKFGKLPWSELITPAVGYAKNGFKIAEKQYQYREDALGLFKDSTNFNDYFGNMKVGETFKQPELAQTLERIADKGVSEFYQGKTADLLVAQMQADKGLITKEDLKDYKAVWREPMALSWRGNVVYTAPPPSSGGVVICQIMNILEGYPMKDLGFHSAQGMHYQIEAMRHAYVDRNSYLGDPDFVKNPIEHLLDKNYATKLRDAIQPQKAGVSAELKPGVAPHEGSNT
ncbi:MAG: gamma-glutamyltransferase family protein, partial [Pseudomonas sp.]